MNVCITSQILITYRLSLLKKLINKSDIIANIQKLEFFVQNLVQIII